MKNIFILSYHIILLGIMVACMVLRTSPEAAVISIAAQVFCVKSYEQPKQQGEEIE